MTNYSNVPTDELIQGAPIFERGLMQTVFTSEAWQFIRRQLDAIDNELDSRTPHFEPEYDSTGQIVTSEVMGYTEDGEEIWS